VLVFSSGKPEDANRWRAVAWSYYKSPSTISSETPGSRWHCPLLTEDVSINKYMELCSDPEAKKQQASLSLIEA